MLTIDTLLAVLSFGIACFGLGYSIGKVVEKKVTACPKRGYFLVAR